jgi:hypothetical protein
MYPWHDRTFDIATCRRSITYSNAVLELLRNHLNSPVKFGKTLKYPLECYNIIYSSETWCYTSDCDMEELDPILVPVASKMW